MFFCVLHNTEPQLAHITFFLIWTKLISPSLTLIFTLPSAHPTSSIKQQMLSKELNSTTSSSLSSTATEAVAFYLPITITNLLLSTWTFTSSMNTPDKTLITHWTMMQTWYFDHKSFVVTNRYWLTNIFASYLQQIAHFLTNNHDNLC